MAPPFVWPSGYHYRHYTVGWLLPAAFLNRTYYLDNFGDYGLASPPDGFGWFRYGPDLLLVDMGSGRISSVVPGVFDEAVVPEITSDADSPQ